MDTNPTPDTIDKAGGDIVVGDRIVAGGVYEVVAFTGTTTVTQPFTEPGQARVATLRNVATGDELTEVIENGGDYEVQAS